MQAELNPQPTCTKSYRDALPTSLQSTQTPVLRLQVLVKADSKPGVQIGERMRLPKLGMTTCTHVYTCVCTHTYTHEDDQLTVSVYPGLSDFCPQSPISQETSQAWANQNTWSPNKLSEKPYLTSIKLKRLRTVRNSSKEVPCQQYSPHKKPHPVTQVGFHWSQKSHMQTLSGFLPFVTYIGAS